jgi:hypothetical protein
MSINRCGSLSRWAAGGSRGLVVSTTSQYCQTLAYPFFMTPSPLFDIIQGPNEILVLAEREMGSRHSCINGNHPDPSHLEPTANSDSVGHWEGDTLVVDRFS